MKKSVLVTIIVILVIMLIGLIFVAVVPSLGLGGNNVETEPVETQPTQEPSAPTEENAPVVEEVPQEETIPEDWPEEFEMLSSPEAEAPTEKPVSPQGSSDASAEGSEDPAPTVSGESETQEDLEETTPPAENEEPTEEPTRPLIDGIPYPEDMTELG